MKKILLKLYVCFLILLIGNGCDLLGSEDQYPGVSIYKTNGDYFNLVDIGMKGDQIYRSNKFWNSRSNSYHFIEFKNNDTVYTQRYRLDNGYILDGEADERYDVFLNMTHKEYLKREMLNHGSGLGAYVPNDTLHKYVLDKDPYIVFYRNRTEVKRFYIRDSLEIKEIVKNGEIDKYFEKIK